MRGQSWMRAVATTLGCFISESRAQTGQVSDLGTLLAGQKNLTTFYSLIQKYPQILLALPSYQGVTILAPNNDAFNKIPYTELNTAFKSDDQNIITNVLEYHILQGSKTAAQLVPGTPEFLSTLLSNPSFTNVTNGAQVENVKQSGDVVVFVSGKGSRSTVTQPDLQFTGGYIQVIDSLLIPPANLTTTIESFNLTSFEGALYQADMIANFSNTPNCTIFVPKNDAFQALGPAISNMTVEQLSSVLDYHLVPSHVAYTTDLANGSTLATTHGENITIRHAGNNIYINSAQLLTADILIANGVLHVIDNVLNPQGPYAMPNPDIGLQGAVFASASSVATLPFTTAIPCTSACPVTTSAMSDTSSGAAASSIAAAKSSKTSTMTTSSSKGFAAAMARETGYGAAGMMVAIGGAVLMI